MIHRDDAQRAPQSAANACASEYLPLRSLSTYAGLSVRRLRDYLRDPVAPLPHYRIGGKVLVKRAEYDSWAVQFRSNLTPVVDRLLDDVMRGLV
jgi:hypothetical protein